MITNTVPADLLCSAADVSCFLLTNLGSHLPDCHMLVVTQIFKIRSEIWGSSRKFGGLKLSKFQDDFAQLHNLIADIRCLHKLVGKLHCRRCKIGPRLLCRTNRKSHARFRLAPKSITLNSRNVTLAEIK